MKFPCIVQSINFGGLRVSYGIDNTDTVNPSYYGCYRSDFCKDLIGLVSNFIPLTKSNDLAGNYKTIIKNLEGK